MGTIHDHNASERLIDTRITAWADTVGSDTVTGTTETEALWADKQGHANPIIDQFLTTAREVTNGAPAETGAPPRH